MESDPHIDAPLLYDYEGGGSPAGSVGCCSILEADNDLDFLNHLDLKFKTLAEICTGKHIEVEGPVPHQKPAARPRPSPSPSPAPCPAPCPTMAHKGIATVAAGTEAKRTGSLHTSSSSSSAVLEEQVVSAAAAVQRHSTAQQTMVLPSPAYILQPQPMYIATAPRLQTAHYLVDQEAALQGMYVLSDTVRPSGLLAGTVAHGTLSNSGRVVILEQGAGPGQASQINLVPAGTAAAQKVVVESRRGGAAQANGGLLAKSGARQEVVFPGDANLPLSEGKSFLLEARRGSPLLGNEAVDSQGALSTLNQTSSHKLVVQEKVSVTESSIHG